MALATAAFLTMGVWSRGLRDDPYLTHEQNLQRTGDALARVEAGFKWLRPTLPSHSHVHASILATGPAGVNTHLRKLRVLSFWYSDSTILTLTPGDERAGHHPEYLFWITPALDVFEIDLGTMRPRFAGAKPAYPDYQRTVRTYALGLAGSGQVDRAVAMPMAMPKMSLPDSILDYRMAGMMLLASGRDAEARSLIHLVPTFDHETAIATIAEILTDSVGERRADAAAMEAFGFEATDLRALKDLMNWAGNHGRTAEALRVASRIRELHPGDVDAGGWIERIAHAKPEDRWYGGN